MTDLDFTENQEETVQPENSIEQGKIIEPQLLSSIFKLYLKQSSIYFNHLDDNDRRRSSNNSLVDLLITLSKQLNINYFFDIGSYNGDASINIKTAIPTLKCFAFEANINNYEAFKSRNEFTTLSIDYRYLAINNYKGLAQFHIPLEVDSHQYGKNIGCASLLLKTNEKIKYQVTEVECTTLDDFCLHNLPEDIEPNMALWIDVEGAALKVIEGCSNSLNQTSLIFVEVEEYQFWENAALADNVTAKLLDRGFLPIARDFSSKNQYNILFIHSKYITNIETELTQYWQKLHDFFNINLPKVTSVETQSMNLPIAVKLSRCLFSPSLKTLMVSGYLTGAFEQQYGSEPANAIQYILLVDENNKELGRCFVSNDLLSSPGTIMRVQHRLHFDFLGEIETTPSSVQVIIVPVKETPEPILQMRSLIDVTDVDSSIPFEILGQARATIASGIAKKYLNTGHSLHAQGYLNLAVFLYIRVLRIAEKDSLLDDKDAVKIAEAFKRRELKIHALALLRLYLPRKIEMSKWQESAYPHLFDFYCRLLESEEEVEHLCRQDLALNGESYWLHTNLGHLAYHKGNRAAADAHYITAARLLASKNVLNFHGNRGVLTWRSLDFVQFIDEQRLEDCLNLLPRTINTSVDLSIKPEIVHLLACDDNYFKKYGEIAIQSSIAQADIDNLVIHLYITNPSEETIEEIRNLQSTTSVRINTTFEAMSSDYCNKAYYTCLRFLIAPVLLKTYDCGVLITEVDAAITCKWSEIVNKVKEQEVYLSNENIFSRPYPWAAAAALVYFSCTPFAIRMAELIAKYISVVFDFQAIEQGNWVIDQVAIGQAIDFLSLESETKHKIKYLALKKILLLANYIEGGKKQFIEQLQLNLEKKRRITSKIISAK